jgi:nucleoside-diphosphate-sugar epimerase
MAPYGTIAVAGRWIAIGSGRLTLPLVHVNDVVDGLIAAATRPSVSGAVFHLVDATPVTQREYIARCQDEAAGALRVHYVPRALLLAAGALLDIVGALVKRHLPLTRYRVRSINALTFDCSAARRQLGWEPMEGVTPRRIFASRHLYAQHDSLADGTVHGGRTPAGGEALS